MDSSWLSYFLQKLRWFGLLLLVAAVVIGLGILLRRFIRERRNASKARQLGCGEVRWCPTPWWDPIGLTLARRVGKADRAQALPDLVASIFDEVSAYYGRDTPTYYFEIFGFRVLMTTDPENVKAILATQFDDFWLGEERYTSFAPLLGRGIFASDGKDWEKFRAMLRPNFTRGNIDDLDLLGRHSRNLMAALPTSSTGWTGEVDLQVLFYRLTLDTSTQFLFGESVESQLALRDYTRGNPERDQDSFAAAFDTAQWHLARSTGMYWWGSKKKEYRAAIKICHEFVDRYVNIALQTTEKRKDKYIFLEELAQSTRDPIELRSQLLHILLAGRDTTAALLGWLFLMLARHPHVWQKLRAAVLNDFGSYEAPAQINFGTLKQCQYLQYCLNEALRLYPPVPHDSRSAARDTVLPRGGGPRGDEPIFLPKGIDANYMVYSMHRRKALWGEDALSFRPERWADRKYGWEFLPWNGGPRICLGQQFALTSAGYTTVRMLQRFDRITDCNPDYQIRHNLSLTTVSAEGVRVNLHDASKA